MTGQTTRTTCPYCGVGCGVAASVDDAGTVAVTGDEGHPSNRGRLCSKGTALADTVGLADRLLHPRVDGHRADWNSALDRVAGGFAEIIAEHGPDAVAFYVSGQLLTEDYYVANKLMKGYIGSANIDTNSRLCMSSAVAGHKRAFGEDAVPGCYDDLEIADLVVLVGSNLAWCHPVVYQRLMAAREPDPKKTLVVIDPRRTATADSADLHLPIAPGSDVALFNGLLAYLAGQGITSELPGADAAIEAAQRMGDAASVAQAVGVDIDDLAKFFTWFAATERAVTVFSQGVNQSSAGTDKVNAIINCHLLTDRIGKPGACPFSITGQPNAMGGREVGGLASTLAAHMGFDRADTVQRFWGSPTIARKPGLKAVELFEAIEAGRIKAIWIMATNPVVSLPDADRARRALAACPLVVVSDVMRHTDTVDCADVLLPAAAWAEKSGTVTNSERMISRQRAFLPLPGEARADWRIISEVARRMGFGDDFAYESAADIFREHAALTAFENNGERVLDLGALASITDAEYETLSPIRWPLSSPEAMRAAGAMPARADADRLFTDDAYPHADGRAHLVPVAPRGPANRPSTSRPLALNTGRVRDHWHTMTRTAKSERLAAHIAEPFVEIHPEDAQTHAIVDGRLATVTTDWGQVTMRAVVTDRQRQGSLFAPIHWNRQFASAARVGAAANPAVCPIAGEPEFKHTPASIAPYEAVWYGFVYAARPLRMQAQPGIDHWTRVPGARFNRYEIAGIDRPGDWTDRVGRWLSVEGRDVDWLDASDPASGLYRAAHIDGGTLEAAVFIAPTPERLPDRSWLAGLFTGEPMQEAERMAVLAGRPADASADTGPLVCSCFGVGRKTIRRAIEAEGLDSVEAVGRAVEAGTNCGSCKPEIAEILAEASKD
ncbi:nitrate reductase [Salinisphaera hydrothermalis]|uniref:Nitrate reductase n=1 Tax=Salinisphaera hydrothermalis (strain C41B8) TaxID=1304275 RepID=A0A084INX6_SALHC|nr:nitrate reductase [Salinisphaera hydrothermalis]KEZ78410.1 nitrate reductase [Salinisphaera hydrothermalis C41B8]